MANTSNVSEIGGYPEDNITCHPWLKEALGGYDNVTIGEVNGQLIRRNIGGIVLLSILMVIGLIGNLHVLFIYLRQFKKSNYRVYVLWLAMMDITYSVVVAPLVIFYLLHPVDFPSVVLCKIFRFVLYTISIASTSSLIVIAVDRYRKVCNPLGSHFSSSKAKLLCGASLGFAIIMSWPAPILFGLSSTETGVPGLTGFRCYTEDRFKTTFLQIIYNAILGIYFFAVSGTLVFVYIRIGKHIRTHHRFQESIRQMTGKREDDMKMATGQNARKSTYTLCAVTIAYILSALPHHLLAAIIFLKKNFDCTLSLTGAQIYYTFIWSYFVNSVINPFIYGIRDRKFRFAVKRIYAR